jgi:hypothetical protein
MTRPRDELTLEIQQAIVAYIRAGGYPHVAAEAAGVPRRVFERWLRQGEAEGSEEQYRAFAEAVRQAQAQARLGAEVAARNERPMSWLRSGPGKQTGDATGWTGPVRGAPEVEKASPLLHPEVQQLLRLLLEALTPYPEARSAAARAISAAIPRSA